jgi:hypothetical protein
MLLSKELIECDPHTNYLGSGYLQSSKQLVFSRITFSSRNKNVETRDSSHSTTIITSSNLLPPAFSTTPERKNARVTYEYKREHPQNLLSSVL